MVEHADDSVEESGVLALYIAKEPAIEKAKSMKVKNKKYLAMQETFIVKGPFGKVARDPSVLLRFESRLFGVAT